MTNTVTEKQTPTAAKPAVSEALQQQAAKELMATLHQKVSQAVADHAKLPQGMVEDTIKLG